MGNIENIENMERFEALSAAELAALGKNKRAATNTLVIWVGMFIVFAAGAIWSGSRLYIIVFFLFAPLPLWLIVRREFQGLNAVNRDIQGGQKKIVVSRIESQRQDINQTGGGDLADDALGTSGPSMSYAYLLKVEGREVKVSERQYYQCKPGELVELHQAPHSAHVFSITVL